VLLEIAQSMGVEFIPCQQTMDMFGLTRDDLMEGMADPVGAATVVALMQEGWAPLFIYRRGLERRRSAPGSGRRVSHARDGAQESARP
jgi:hypothetical protein